MKVTKFRSRALVALALAGGLLLAQAGSVYAMHCYVADKPDGAGVGGAFMTMDGQDVFNFNLPEPAHENGSPDHGVLEMEE